MNVIFVLCEGPHDAQFVGRLLLESKKFSIYNSNLSNYPFPVGEFFQGKLKNRSVGDLRLGKPDFPLIPMGAYNNHDASTLVFPVSLGGMTKYDSTREFISELEVVFSPDALQVERSQIKSLSILLMYDADSRGAENTTKLFIEKFSGFYDLASDVAGKWIKVRDHHVSLFVFTDADGQYGVLEDTLMKLFKKKAHHYIDNLTQHFDKNFEPRAIDGDLVAYEAKKKKAILTTCGQLEPRIAGSALTVVVRDSNLLTDAFDFSEHQSIHSRLLERIESI